ncbi:MAG: molecular chaperone HtpG [Balneolales bacterium]
MTKTKRQQFEFKAEMKQLLHLIVNSLYTNPEVFLRELISNASDALNKVRFKQITSEKVQSPKLPHQIKIEVDEKTKAFSIEDTGIGMAFEDLTERLGTVAGSGTMEFIQQLKEQKSKLDGNMIGQFGVGFYSAFMVTDEITVETRHADPGQKGWRWISDGQGTFEIEEIERVERGTRIAFRFKDEYKKFATPERIKQLIRKYSNFVDYSILVNGEEVNSKGALWHKSKKEVTEEELNEFYKFISNDFQEPLDHLHLAMEGRMNFKALIFVPRKAKTDFFNTNNLKSLQLYSNRVFVQDDCKDLLPEYLRFVEGLVDSEDLPLNVSREVTQYSPVMAKIRDVLVSKIYGMIEYWAESEPEKFQTFYDEFGPLFKSGLNSDFANRDRLIELMRFHSTKTVEELATRENSGKADTETASNGVPGDRIALRTYVERMTEGQKEIYYLSGDNLEELQRDPRLEYFRKKGIEVLLLDDPVDAFLVPGIGDYMEKPLKSIEKADLDIDEVEADEEKEKVSGDALTRLIEIFREETGDHVENVVASRRLVDSPVTLTIGKEGMDSHIERMMKMMDQKMGPSKRIFEINPTHPVIRNLSRMQQAGQIEEVKLIARQLYEGALLLQGDLASPGEFVKRMNQVLEMVSGK